MASADARPIPQKNVAYRVTFPLFDADGDLVTGAAGLDSEVSKDGGTFADCTNEATEIATSSGMYYLDLTATEMNADTVAIIVKTSTTGAKTTPIVLYPEEAGDVRVNVTQIGGTNQTAGDLATMITAVDDLLDTEIGDIRNRLPAALVSGRIDASVGAMAADVVTASAVADNAIDAASIATGAITSAKFAAGAIDNAAIAADAIGSSEFAQAAADKVWSSAARTLTSLGASLVQEIWDRATSALSTAGSVGKLLVDNINATISSRSSHSAADVWTVGARSLTDKAGFSLSASGIQAIWDALTSALTTAGSIGKLIVDNLNAAVSSRSSHSAADVWAVGTRALTDKANFTLTSGERDSIAGALLDLSNGIETGLTLRQAMRLLAAADAGKLSGAATTTIVIRNAVADSKARITATCDSDGNRTAIVYDLT